MNLQKIKDKIIKLKELMSNSKYDGWQLWILLDQFQTNWDIDAVDFGEMFHKSFGINSPLWYREGYTPQKAMERYIDMNTDYVRAMFLDLLNEDKDIVSRINRFLHGCEELYKVEQKNNQVVAPHDHDDRKMIFIYLCFCYPERYSLFEFPAFKGFMSDIGSASIPQEQDTERFIKVCRTLNTFINKDEELVALIRSRGDTPKHNTMYSMLAVFEMYVM